MDKLKKGKRKSKEKPELPSARVLLSSAWYDFGAFVDRFEGKWNYTIGPYWEENLFAFIADGMVVRCDFCPAPVAEQTLERDARRSFLWSDAKTRTASHTAYILVSVISDAVKKKDPITAHRLLSKTVSGLLESDNAIGVWLNPGLLEKSHYIKAAKALVGDTLPTELWVHIDAWESAEGFSLATFGMKRFHKNEFEILNSKKNFIDCYYHLKQIIDNTLSRNITFKDGDTIGGDDHTRSRLTLSKGVFAPGITLKIEY